MRSANDLLSSVRALGSEELSGLAYGVILLKNQPLMLRHAQHERKIVNSINLIPVRPEPGRRVNEGCSAESEVALRISRPHNGSSTSLTVWQISQLRMPMVDPILDARRRLPTL